MDVGVAKMEGGAVGTKIPRPGGIGTVSTSLSSPSESVPLSLEHSLELELELDPRPIPSSVSLPVSLSVSLPLTSFKLNHSLSALSSPSSSPIVPKRLIDGLLAGASHDGRQ
jgi:hypothetical protein